MDSTDLPPRLRGLLAGSPLEGPTFQYLHSASLVLSDNKTPFFPAYTDHGSIHVERVVKACERLIPDEVWEEELLHPEDSAALICGCLLHDLGLHLREEQFMALIAKDSPCSPVPWFDETQPGRSGDVPWSDLWEAFRTEARHFTRSHLDLLLGPSHRGTPAIAFGDNDQSWDLWTNGDRLLAGEFLRRHHGRLAHEIAAYGFPGAPDAFPVLSAELPGLADAVGALARSHAESLRKMVRYCEYHHPGSQRPWGTVLPYLMGLLRVADYVQLDADRAPPLLLRLRSPVSQASIFEWNAHGAIATIEWEHRDVGAIDVQVAARHGLRTHLHLCDLLANLQLEFDTTTAVLSETYATAPLDRLRLSRTRVRSNLQEPSLERQLPYIARRAALRSDEDLFRLVISDLYGDEPAVAGRELVQNAVDAVRARRRWEAGHGRTLRPDLFREQRCDVEVTLSDLGGDDLVLRVADRGIGMTSDVVIDYFLKAGASFGPTRSDFEEVPTDDAVAWMKAGRFGVGIFAAFLLGGSVEVETRNAESAEGLRFTANIDDDLVQLDRADLPLGTQVSIPFKHARLRSVRPWRIERSGRAITLLRMISRFYRLRDPQVSFQFVSASRSASIDARADMPLPRRRLPDDWRQVDVSGYDGVLWHTRPSSSSSDVVHNGMTIMESEDGVRGRRDTYRWSDGSIARLIRRPSVGVFDSRHLLGVALHRYRLKSKTLPFEQELLRSVGLEIVAHALTAGPIHSPFGEDWGLTPVVGRQGWVPLLPRILYRHLDDDVCVLWTPGDYRRAPPDRGGEESLFKRTRGGISWRNLRYRTVLELETVTDHRDPEVREWGYSLGDIHRSASRLGQLIGPPSASLVVRQSRGYKAEHAVHRYTEQAESPWQAIDVPQVAGGASMGAVRRERPDCPIDPKTIDNLMEAADRLLAVSNRGSVALSLFPLATRECLSKDVSLTAAWHHILGGQVPRSRRELGRLRAEAASGHRELRSSIRKWQRVLGADAG